MQQGQGQVMDLARDLAAEEFAAGDLAKGSAALALAEGSSGSAPGSQQAEGWLAGCWELRLLGLLLQV